MNDADADADDDDDDDDDVTPTMQLTPREFQPLRDDRWKQRRRR